jgi:hypothetical protein
MSEPAASPPRPPTLRGLLPTLTVSAVLPFVTYRLLTAYAPSAGRDPVLVARFDALWQRPHGPRTFRVMTLVWAIGWLAEFALRIVMVETLTIPTALAISPFVFGAINLGLFAWMFAYVRRVRRRAIRTLRSD